ncbi:hypothetical protein PPYR_09715 [Photinus pyralis]|uniref:Uncharacterized protein n=1 Tax=Photinus pyralis TaxID=7054 RepID=A0A5N4AMY7_PHOPY|nr:hypothetical protein PPYR_09715 [Photinus pyralis]
MCVAGNLPPKKCSSMGFLPGSGNKFVIPSQRKLTRVQKFDVSFKHSVSGEPTVKTDIWVSLTGLAINWHSNSVRTNWARICTWVNWARRTDYQQLERKGLLDAGNCFRQLSVSNWTRANL